MPDDELTPREMLQWYFDQANAGDPLAMRELGRMYLHGFTHDEDPDVEILPDGDQADRWLSESTDAGDDEAAWLLGILYDGEATGGAFDDPEKAFHCYQQAVDRGYRPARSYLAARYLIGRGVQRNDQLGIELLIEAAYGGNTNAQSFMAKVCENTAMTKVRPHGLSWLRCLETTALIRSSSNGFHLALPKVPA